MTDHQSRILDAYLAHPLSARAIMQRITKSASFRGVVSELDLCTDPIGEITDQNHIGGAESTFRLARHAGICRNDVVLDLACGIGGPARLLAATYGCHVHGVDIIPSRIADAAMLTSFAKLSDFVTFECADISAFQCDPKYTVVWGQNSWLHIQDIHAVARVAAKALVPRGRLAFEEICLTGRRPNAVESQVLAEVESAWLCTLKDLNSWTTAFASAGFECVLHEQEHNMLIPYLAKLREVSVAAPEVWPSLEVIGFDRALALARADIIGYFRVVATSGP